MKELRYLSLFFVVLALTATTHAATSVVQMVSGNAFNPTTSSINTGDTILWTNTTLTPHNTTSSSGIWASSSFTRPSTFSFQFNSSGSFPYSCTIHFGQNGTINVAGAPNVLPTVTITNPANGAILTAPATFTLAASASDSDGTISQVQFFNGAGLLGADTTSPYSVQINNFAAGNYTLSAVATDNSGGKSTNTITLIVNAPPTVSITSPTNGAAFIAPANVTVNATAADADGITKVQFFNGVSSAGIDSSNPYSVTLSNLAAGTYTLTARATDTRGATNTSTPVTITVSNAPPAAVTINSPSFNGSKVQFSFPTETNHTYAVQRVTSVTDTNWQTITNVSGNGAGAIVQDFTTNSPQAFYRVSAQ